MKTVSVDNIDLNKYQPIDVIQIMYQKGVKVSNPGGNIWKMGRCSTPPGSVNPQPGTALEQSLPFTDIQNSVVSGDELCIIEVPLP